MSPKARVALTLLAVAGGIGFASVPQASAACDVDVEFRNPYLSPVTVDLRESKAQIRLGSPVNSYGPKRKLGTGTLRVNAGSTRRRAFDLPLGTCRSRRQFTWVMTYRGDQNRHVIRGVGSQYEVRFADFAGMPPRPFVRTPVLTRSPPQLGTGSAIVPNPLFAWTVARSRNGSFPWTLWRIEGGRQSMVADGSTTRTQLRIPRQENGRYKLDLWQQDGAGYRSAKVQAQASLGNQTDGYQFTISAVRVQPRG